mgnify:CR=1 FL=1
MRIKVRYISLALLILFLMLSSTIITPSQSNYFSVQKNPDEWFDGNFKGFFGENKDYLDGIIDGNINLGRTSSIGKFFGKCSTFENETTGNIQGRFRNKILTGIIKTDHSSNPCFFIGFISLKDTGFEATIFSLKTKIMYIKGTYESSFLPPLTGPYGVGIKEMHLVDENRSERFTDDPNDNREMMIRIWYPVNKEINTPYVEYMDTPTFAWLKDRSPVPLVTIPDNAYEFVGTHSFKDINISENKESYPVLIFSPGYDGVYQIYTSLIENIVSHGFIVVSINHPYVSGITVFPDGRKKYVSSNSTGDIGLNSVVGDAKFVLDEITKFNQSDEELMGRFDLSRVGMYGHSFGGASTAICCYEDSRFLCGLTLDGVFYVDNMTDGLSKPFMMMIAENRFNDENAGDMWDLLNDDSYKVEIIGSTHYAYSDVGVLLNHMVPLIPNKILGFGTIEPKRCVNITRMFELAFFEVYLKDGSVSNIMDLANSYEDVNFENK